MPDFPIIKCKICGNSYELPRKWIYSQNFGYQILIDWEAAARLDDSHVASHSKDMVQELEEWVNKC